MTATTPIISLTPEAMKELRDYMDEQGTPEAMLRVFVSPGGCSGLSYGMSVEEDADEEDFVVEQDGVRILVDQFSAMYVEGAEIETGARGIAE